MEWICIGLGGIIALVVIFAVVGMFMSKRGRANAPDRLEEARRLFAAGEQYAALKGLEEAFWVPVTEEYEADDARTAHGAIVLLGEILADMNTDASTLLDPLLTQLEAAKDGGGVVDYDVTQPVETFLHRAADAENLRDDLVSLVREGVLEVEEQREQEFSMPPDAGEMDIINKVGRFLLRGKERKAVEFIDQHLEGTEGRFRAELLNQRGGAHFMAEDFDAALTDYEECAQIQPDDAMHYSNAAEAAEKLGDVDTARRHAEKAIEVGGDRDAISTAEDVLSRH